MGYLRNDTPDQPSHFFYPVSSVSYRSLCEAVETTKDHVYGTTYVDCLVCKGQGAGQLAEEAEVRMSGAEPELTTEEYMIIFNRAVAEGEELSYHLPAVKELSPEELVDHVNLLSKFSSRIRIAKQAVKMTLEAKRIHLDSKQKEALKLRDMQYKPKPVADPNKPAKARRASGTAKSEDAIETIMRLMGCTREQAEKRLAKAKATVESAEEQS